MEKINVAELLKDCPKGMELDCAICNGVKFKELDKNPNFPIVVRSNGYEFTLTKYGQVHNIEDAKCVIFPKGKTTWEGFQRPFKDGDVVTNIEGVVIIYRGITTYGYCGSFVSLDHYNQLIPHYKSYLTDSIRLATEEEKQKLFDAIKANGYKWNTVTKTLEKLIVPKFNIYTESK